MESWITEICLNFRPEWPRTFAPLFLNYNNWYLINVLYSTNARNRKNIVLQASSQLFVEAFDFRHKRKGDLGGCAINFLVYRYLLQAHWKTFLARNGKNSLEVRVATLSRLSVPLISHHCDVQPSSCQFLQKRVSSISRQTFIYSAQGTTQNKFLNNKSATIATNTMVKPSSKRDNKGTVLQPEMPSSCRYSKTRSPLIHPP